MNLKYISVGALVVIIALFYFMHQSNEASAERLKQAEIANQQRLEQNKIDEAQAKKNYELERIQAEKAKALKVEQDKLSSQKQAKEFEQKRESAAIQTNKPEVSGNKYSEEDWLSICKSSAGAAKVIMSSRQRGAAMTDMMDRVVRPADPAIKDIVKAFVIDAYNRPRFDTPEYQQKAILDFENYAYLTCIKVRQ